MRLEYTDAHMHVIPGIDDGSPDMATSLEMVRLSYEQGVRQIFCTSHGAIYYGRERKMAYRAFEELCRICKDRWPDLTLHPGAEIRVFPEEMPKLLKLLKKGKMPTLAGTKYILLEFANFDITFEMIRDSLAVFLERGYHPVIAHVEQYYTVIPTVEAARYLHDMGCLFQVNADSVTDPTNLSVHQRAHELLNCGLVDLLGSDAHNADIRAPHLAEAISLIEERYGAECVKAAEKEITYGLYL